MSIGSRIAKIRGRVGRNQIDFAKDLGVSQSAFKNYERGASEPPVGLLINLCKRYNVGADWLVLGQGAETPKALFTELEIALVDVRKWAQNFPIPVPPEKEAQMVSVLLRYRLENDAPSAEMEQFLMEKVA
jgi:transcriptional regulator with XRE-family HTH domain